MSVGEQPGPKDEADAADRQYEDARDRFSHAAALGDTFLFFDYWSAWSVIPEKKRIAPVTRIYIGDEQGNVVFERPVVFNALADLVVNFSIALRYEVDKLVQMPGYKFHTPQSPADLFANLQKAEEALKAVRDQLEKGGLLVQIGDDLKDSTQT